MPSRSKDEKSKEEGEAGKVVISRSRRLVLWQCLIHCLPIATSTVIIYVNYHGYFIGADFPGMTNADTIALMLLQVAAKFHEIIIVASLSQVVWQAVRYELLYGEGLPLGLLGSALSFSSLEFYFKKGFFGSLSFIARGNRKLKRLGFVVLLIVSGITAIFCGPSSAILLVPQIDTYDAGGTDVYLNGSADKFWPSDLSDSTSELQTLCSVPNNMFNDICPAGGFVSLWDRWRGVNLLDPIGGPVPTFASNLSGSRFYWPIHSSSTRIPPLYTLGNPRDANGIIQPYTWLVQAHAASAVVLDRVTRDWWQALLAIRKTSPELIADRDIAANSSSPFVGVRCSDLQSIPPSSTNISFPSVYLRWVWAKDISFNATSANLERPESLRFQWVQLPSQFGVVSIGGLLELPWTGPGNERYVVGCSAQTGWVPTTLRTDASTFWSGWYSYDIQFGWRAPNWSPDQGQNPTNGRIALSQTWLDMLTPDVPSMPGYSDQGSMSTIEAILLAAGIEDSGTNANSTTQAEAWTQVDESSSGGKKRLLESIIASVLADGLSRTGSHLIFQQAQDFTSANTSMYLPRKDFNQRILNGENAFVQPSDDPSTFTVLQASMQISGFVFKNSVSSGLAVIVLGVHVLLSLCHMIWLIINRQVSRSWDSIAEMITLAQNSRPAENVLRNTSAGIERWRTYATIAHVRVRKKSDDEHSDHVELVFEDDSKQKAESADCEESIVLMPQKRPSVDRGREAGQPVLHESWTFPVDRHRSRSTGAGECHTNDISDTHLLIKKRSNASVRDLVQPDCTYS